MALRSARSPWSLPAAAAVATILCLTAGGLWSACGDFTLWSEGPPPGPGPTPTENVCEHAFAGLAAYENSVETPVDDTLSNPVAMDVVPPGMTFPVSGGTVSAEAGDLVAVEDLEAAPGAVYLYDRSQNNQRHLIPTEGTRFLGGLALYHEEIAGGGQKRDLLFYTALNDISLNFNVFIHDLQTQTTLFRYPDDWPGPAYLFTRPAALAMGRNADRRGLFIADNRTSVVRMGLVVSELGIVPETVGKIAEGFTWVRDLVFFDQTQALYLTEYVTEPTDDSRVYRVNSALTQSTTNPVTKTQLTPFIPSDRVFRSVGIAIAPVDQKAEAADLLVFNQRVQDAIGQFDANTGQARPAALDILQENHLDLAYDCQSQNGRLLFSRQPPASGLFQLVPR